MNYKSVQVSLETLAGINWMGPSRLVSVMEQAANRGPLDKNTWKKFITRAEVIAYTNGFRPIQVSRILRYMDMANYRDERFLRKLHSLIDTRFIHQSDLGTFCGIIQGFKRLKYPEIEYKKILDLYKNFVPKININNYYEYSLILNAYTYPEYVQIVEQLLNMHIKSIDKLSAQELSIIINSTTSLSHHNDKLAEHLPIMYESLLDKADTIDLKSAIIILNAMSRVPKLSQNALIEVLLNKISEKVNILNIQQAVMILRAITRLKCGSAQLIESIFNRLLLILGEAEPLQISSIIASMRALNINFPSISKSIIDIVSKNCRLYSLSDLSQITYRLFSNDWLEGDSASSLAEVISRRINDETGRLSVHDIVLLCLSLNKYWSSTDEFNKLEKRLLGQANKLISEGIECSEADREVICRLTS